MSERAVKINPLHVTERLLLRHQVYPAILPSRRVYQVALGHGEDGSLGIELISCPAVEPAYCPAVGDPLRGDEANVGGSKGLTENAAIELIDILITEFSRPRIPGLINLQSMGEEFLHLLPIGDEGDGNLLNDIQLRGEEEDQDFTYLPQGIKPLLKRRFIEPEPDVVPLSYVPESLDVIGVHMDPSLEDRLHILFELFPGDIN
ncbi:MAG: hypothetical protein DDT24_00377 [Chloroflexi bacterium]|nr:hypothetical protein [Chloroflexota bacterium]